VLNMTELQRDTITELLNIGMGRAAAALSEMVGEEVALSVPCVEVLSRRDAAALVRDKGCERIVAVLQEFSGFFWGDTMLVFPEDQSLDLVHSLIKDTFPLDIMTEMEQEALMEVGNITLNACIGSIANFLQSEVSSSLPSLLRGPCETIFSDKNGVQVDHEVVMFLRMDFALRARDMHGCVVFLVDGDAIRMLREHIDRFLDQPLNLIETAMDHPYVAGAH
jgi:chemotaxis protein CheC